VSRRVIIDADACPRGAMRTVRRLQGRYGYEIVTVATVNHVIEDQGAGHEHVTVGPEPQAADMAVANRARAGDVVVTQDWGLAALVLGKGCRAISPAGRTYRPDTIETLLEVRHLEARFRRGGGRTRGPRARSAEDEARFERALIRALEGRPSLFSERGEGAEDPRGHGEVDQKAGGVGEGGDEGARGHRRVHPQPDQDKG